MRSKASPSGPVRIIAHRGGAAFAPENTLSAFERSLALGIPEVETDVRLSRDGALVLFHDAELAGKTALAGRVEDHSLAALRAADLRDWFARTNPDAPVPPCPATVLPLDELFERFGRRLYYHLEIKGASDELPERLLAAIRGAGLRSRCSLTSFSRKRLVRVLALDARIPLTWLLRRANRSASPVRVQRARIATAAELGFDEVSLAAEELTPRLVAYAQSLGLEVRAWRVRTRDEMRRALAAGAAGMTLDDPTWLLAQLLSQADAPALAVSRAASDAAPS